MFKGNIQKITQVRRGSIGTDGLDTGAVESLVKPAVVIVFTDGRPYDQRIVIEVSERPHALIFLVRQHCFQAGQWFVILIKGVKKHNRADHRRKENKRSYEKRFDKFSVWNHRLPFFFVDHANHSFSGVCPIHMKIKSSLWARWDCC